MLIVILQITNLTNKKLLTDELRFWCNEGEVRCNTFKLDKVSRKGGKEIEKEKKHRKWWEMGESFINFLLKENLILFILYSFHKIQINAFL